MLSKDEKEQLEQIANVGFAYAQLLRAIPPHISIKFAPFFNGERGKRRMLARSVYLFSSTSLAIAKGFSAKEREKFIQEREGK